MMLRVILRCMLRARNARDIEDVIELSNPSRKFVYKFIRHASPWLARRHMRLSACATGDVRVSFRISHYCCIVVVNPSVFTIGCHRRIHTGNKNLSRKRFREC
jgi:hypothetical protein